MAVFGSQGTMTVQAQPLRDALTGDVARAILVLLIGVGLLLVTAVANVASLQLARATTRRRELAIRAALGAGTGRVTRQLLVESVLLGIAGGLAGLGLAWLLQGALPAILPADFPRLEAMALDAPVVLFALATSLGSSVLLGLLPAATLRRLSPSSVLAEDGASTVGIGLRSRTARTRLAIMAGQVAIACVLLVGASLLGRSFFAMLHVDRGYDPEGVASARLALPATLYPTPERRYELVDGVITRLGQLPGTSDAAFASEMPLTAGGSTSAFSMRSTAANGEMIQAQASPRIVSERFFATMAMRVTAGRAFGATDTDAAPIAVVVNEAFARRYLGRSPLGTKLPVAGYGPAQGPPLESTVVGVVEDVRYVTGARSSQPELYYDYRQLRGRLPVQVVTLLVRTSGDPALLAPALRTIVREADDRLVADAIMPLDERLLAALARPRLYASVLGAFAALAMATAALGLVGVLSYSVAQRARELAIRSALGASRPAIAALVLRQGLSVIVTGIVIGLVASSWLSRLLATQLYGVTPHDRATFVVVPLLLLLFGALACLTPALRAARLDPLRSLRGD
jgi:putative ABC transport system permease protein